MRVVLKDFLIEKKNLKKYKTKPNQTPPLFLFYFSCLIFLFCKNKYYINWLVHMDYLLKNVWITDGKGNVTVSLHEACILNAFVFELMIETKLLFDFYNPSS